jgi:hypothetical protein
MSFSIITAVGHLAGSNFRCFSGINPFAGSKKLRFSGIWCYTGSNLKHLWDIRVILAVRFLS